jgi:hypothetical protein
MGFHLPEMTGGRKYIHVYPGQYAVHEFVSAVAVDEPGSLKVRKIIGFFLRARLELKVPVIGLSLFFDM